MKLELHIHTRYSSDSLLCFFLLYFKCILNRIDYVAITEHNNILGGKAFKNYCERRGNRLKVIVGEEISTLDGEIIGLFLHKEVPRNLPANKTIKLIKEQGGIVYIPHPYDEKRKKTVLKEIVISQNSELIDCIEIHNGRNFLESYSFKQNEIAEKYRIKKVIGSDAHTFFELGRNYINVEIEPNSPQNFMYAISTATYNKRPCIILAHRITQLVKLFELLKKGDLNELYRIIVRKIKRNKC